MKKLFLFSLLMSLASASFATNYANHSETVTNINNAQESSPFLKNKNNTLDANGIDYKTKTNPFTGRSGAQQTAPKNAGSNIFK